MIAPAGTSPALQTRGKVAMAETVKTPTGIKRSRFVGNIVLRIASYDLSATNEQFYPGVASGVVSGGPLDERRIEIAIRPTATNSRVPKISDFADPASMSHTESGGFIAFENVRESRGSYFADWANRFAGPKDTLRVGMPIRIAPSLNRNGEVRMHEGTGVALHNARILHPRETETVHSKSDMLECAAAAFEGKSAAFLVMVSGGDPSSDSFERRTLTLWRGANPDPPVTAVEAAAAALSRLGNFDFDAAFDSAARCDVIPMEVLNVGVKTSESIDRGAKHAIALKSYRSRGLGERTGIALYKVDPSARSKLERAFLEETHKDARIAFSKFGWRGVRNVDVRQFFRSKGFELPNTASFGFAMSTALLKPYRNGESPTGDLFVVKARSLSSALPAFAVPSVSDPDANNRYSNEFKMIAAKAAAASRAEFDESGEELGLQNSNYPSPQNALLGFQRPSASAYERFNVAADEAEPSGANMDI